MTLQPREAAKFIAESSSDIKISDKGIEKLGKVLIEDINSGALSVENFSQKNVHPSKHDRKALDWLFVVDTLNFCFWSNEQDDGWTVDGHTGYFALCAAINRALKEKVDILNPKFYATITEEQLEKVLRSDNTVKVPLFKERVKCLHEVGAALLENFEGSFKNVISEADGSAVKLLSLIVDNFKCFRDEATYKDKRVAIYKRAQILIGDIWSCYRNEGVGKFNDIDCITMFADYRIPQTLIYFGVLEYTEEVTKKLLDNQVLSNGDELEVEIRGVSIHAVELLLEYVKDKVDDDKEVNAILIDHFLWDFRRKHAKEIVEKKIPFHKTFCIYY